ncbi:MAG: hypothetical protein ACR2JB_14005 [Bryobacteraceae bacterium]
MSLSDKQREKNIVLALRLMMQDRQEPYEWQEHDTKAKKFEVVYRTTWDDLLERGLVKVRSFDRYSLTGAGWIHGLKVLGKFDDPKFRYQAGQLSRALKGRLMNRSDWARVDRPSSRVRLAFLNSSFMMQLTAHLLREMFNIIDAVWSQDDDMKNYIDIHPGFGLPLL